MRIRKSVITVSLAAAALSAMGASPALAGPGPRVAVSRPPRPPRPQLAAGGRAGTMEH